MLTPWQIARFGEQGYLLVEGVLDPESVLQPIIDEYAVRLDHLVDSLIREGRLESGHAELPFRERITAVCRDTGETFAQFFNLSLPIADVTEDTPFHTGPAVFRLIRNHRLLDVVECILGPEIQSNPIQHIRIKPPQSVLAPTARANGLVGSTPWHQDAAVVPPDADIEFVTVWVPINDTPVETGCLQFVAGGHKQGLMGHRLGPVDGLALPPGAIADGRITSVPATAGDVILIDPGCPHSSLPNQSEHARFSLDLRFHPTGRSSGREIFPSFTARSRACPESELIDPRVWDRMWHRARTWMATSPDAPREAYPWLRSG